MSAQGEENKRWCEEVGVEKEREKGEERGESESKVYVV